MREAFRRFARASADAVGSPFAFLLGVAFTLIWAATGKFFQYSDTWQLVINTATSIGTFLMVFLIQNTQNRDSKVMQLKLDELIRALTAARTELVQMESLTDSELDDLQNEFSAIGTSPIRISRGSARPGNYGNHDRARLRSNRFRLALSAYIA